MSRYDEDEETTKGKIVSIKLNAKLESKAGKSYKAHILKVEDEEGEVKRFQVSPKSKASKFVEKLEEGQDVTVKEVKGDYGMQVVAVFVNRKGGKRGFAKTNNRKEYDPTGAIQGMVLKAAIDIATKGSTTGDDLVKEIVEAAKVVLLAKIKVDKLVETAVKSKNEDDEDDDSDDEENDKDDSDDDSETDDEEGSDEEDSEEEARPRKKKKSPY